MYYFQPLDQLKETFPEIDDIMSTTWRSLPLKIVFQRAFVRVFEYHIEMVSMDETAVKSSDTFLLLDAAKAIHLFSVVNLAIFGWVTFELKGIDVNIVGCLSISAIESRQ